MLQQHREHIHRLPGVKLPDSIVVTSDLKQACEGNDLIVFSVASPFVRSTGQKRQQLIFRRDSVLLMWQKALRKIR